MPEEPRALHSPAMGIRLVETRLAFVARGHRQVLVAGFVIGAFGSSACAGSSRQADAPLISVERERSRAERPPEPKRLERAEVERAVADGLGQFLQHVSVEASVTDGVFQGFRILELRPPAAWAGVDLREGDVVTRINGQPIERPEQAYAVFVGLKRADRVVVSYLRGGQPGELVIPIVDTQEPPSGGANAPRDL